MRNPVLLASLCLIAAVTAGESPLALAQNFPWELDYTVGCELHLETTQDHLAASVNPSKKRKEEIVRVAETGRIGRQTGQDRPAGDFKFSLTGEGTIEEDAECGCTMYPGDPQRRYPSRTALRRAGDGSWKFSGSRARPEPIVDVKAHEDGYVIYIRDLGRAATQVTVSGEHKTYCTDARGACDAPPLLKTEPIEKWGGAAGGASIFFCDYAWLEAAQSAASAPRSANPFEGDWDTGKPDFAVSRSFSYIWKQKDGNPCPHAKDCRNDWAKVTLKYTIRAPD